MLTTILVIIFWHFLIIQLRSESPQVKRYLISGITNSVHELSHELPNDLSLSILGNQKILEKCQMWVETQTSVQSSFQKLNVDKICQKTRKIRYYIFDVLSNFTVFLYFLPNILSGLQFHFRLIPSRIAILNRYLITLTSLESIDLFLETSCLILQKQHHLLSARIINLKHFR